MYVLECLINTEHELQLTIPGLVTLITHRENASFLIYVEDPTHVVVAIPDQHHHRCAEIN